MNAQRILACSTRGRCTGHCREGRDCPNSTNASRAALGLPPLHERDGGHSVSGALVFPLKLDCDETMPRRFRTQSVPSPLVFGVVAVLRALPVAAVLLALAVFLFGEVLK
jgi:hypothetical protein